jgi:hypothetical protein
MTAYNPTPVTGYSEGIIESTEKPTRCVETFSDDRADNVNFYFEIDGKFYNVHPRRDDLGGYPVRWIDGFAPIGWPKEETTETTEPDGPTTFEQFQASRKIEETLSDVTDLVDYDAIGLSYLDGRYFIEKQYEIDLTCDVESHLCHYVVYIGNQIDDFGNNLEAAERHLWNEWARGEENWKHVWFDAEFGSDYQLDQGQVLDLIDFGFTDNSWHNNICPCFDLHLDTDDSGREFYVRFWFDAPNPDDREAGPDQPQFAVGLYVDGELQDESYPYPSMFETDDFYLALAYALGKGAKSLEWGDENQIDCQNKFGILLVDWILPQHNAQKWEDYALKATTDEMVDYGIELVAKRKEVKPGYDVACGDCDQKYTSSFAPTKCGVCGSTFIAIRKAK